MLCHLLYCFENKSYGYNTRLVKFVFLCTKGIDKKFIKIYLVFKMI